MKKIFTGKETSIILVCSFLAGCATFQGVRPEYSREKADIAFTAKNYKEASAEYEKSAEKNDAISQYRLAQMYIQGHGFKKNNAEAEKWIRKSADNAYGPARMTLAAWYLDGKKIPADHKKAAELISLEAEKKNPGAMYALGCLYAKGMGVEKDPALAAKWFNDSKEAGYPVPDEMLYEVNIKYPKSSSKSFPVPVANTSLVRNIQSGLIRLGYSPGKPDGKTGKQTVQAVKSYQKKKGLKDNGIISHDLLEKIQTDLKNTNFY